MGPRKHRVGNGILDRTAFSALFAASARASLVHHAPGFISVADSRRADEVAETDN